MVNISPLTSSRFDSFETQVGGAKTFWMNLLCTWAACSKTIWSILCVCYEFWPFTVWTHYCLELTCSIEVGLILCVIYCIRETLRDLEWQERGGSWSERGHGEHRPPPPRSLLLRVTDSADKRLRWRIEPALSRDFPSRQLRFDLQRRDEDHELTCWQHAHTRVQMHRGNTSVLRWRSIRAHGSSHTATYITVSQLSVQKCA